VEDTAYRNDEPVLLARLEPLLVKREEAREDIAEILAVTIRRRARILAGRIGLVGALSTVAAAGLEALSSGPTTGVATVVLLGSAAASVVAYGLVAADPFHRAARDLSRLTEASGDLRREVDRLTSDRDLWTLRETAASLERQSTFLPTAAVSMLAPLTLHFFVALVLSLVDHGRIIERFDYWIMASIVLVGASHLSLLYRASGLAVVLANTNDSEVDAAARSYGWKTVGWTTLYACLPGAIIWLIPVIVSFLTGALIIPALFARIGRLVTTERARIGLPPVD
jgi:hypothetical protein